MILFRLVLPGMTIMLISSRQIICFAASHCPSLQSSKNSLTTTLGFVCTVTHIKPLPMINQGFLAFVCQTCSSTDKRHLFLSRFIHNPIPIGNLSAKATCRIPIKLRAIIFIIQRYLPVRIYPEKKSLGIMKIPEVLAIEARILITCSPYR